MQSNLARGKGSRFNSDSDTIFSGEIGNIGERSSNQDEYAKVILVKLTQQQMPAKKPSETNLNTRLCATVVVRRENKHQLRYTDITEARTRV